MKTIKNFNSILLIPITFVLLCISCSNDDSDNNKTNEIKVNSKSFVIAEAIMFNDGTYDGITEFELYYTSSGVNIDTDENVSGTGHLLSLRLFSNEQDKLPTGNYLYNDQDSAGYLINRGFHFFDYVTTKGDGEDGSIDIESGSLSVSLENDVYSISLNLKDEDGNSVTGYYKGKITLVND